MKLQRCEFVFIGVVVSCTGLYCIETLVKLRSYDNLEVLIIFLRVSFEFIDSHKVISHKYITWLELLKKHFYVIFIDGFSCVYCN